MLEMPDWQSSVSEETANIQCVVDPAGKPWRAAEDAEVMLLGDSFTNIYHLGPMGWGADAGFAEHISLNLGRPLDVLSQNDAGARASRQLLVDALTTNPGRLQNTKVVIWEFAERELALGNWELMQLPEAGQIADPSWSRIRMMQLQCKVMISLKPGRPEGTRTRTTSTSCCCWRPADTRNSRSRLQSHCRSSQGRWQTSHRWQRRMAPLNR